MPLGFIILGIFAIYALFYLKTSKFIVLAFCLSLMASYFIPCLNVGEYSINITFMLTLVIAFVYLLFVNKNYKFIIFSVLANFIYLIVVRFNSDFLTTLNPLLMFGLVTIFGLFAGIKTELLHYHILTLILLTFFNAFLEQPLGYVVVGNITLLSYFGVSYLICYVVRLLMLKLKFLQRRKAWKKLLLLLLV